MGDSKPRQRKFAPRSRQGCLTCRARRKRCDGQRPECANCTRLNVKCQWQSQRQIVAGPEQSKSPSPAPAEQITEICPLRSSLDPWDAFSGDEAAEQRHLLSYYIEAFVPSISIATTQSSYYTRLYIPMALQSKGVFDAIMALASAQLARRTVNGDRAQHLRTLSAKHQGKCHSFIKQRVLPSGELVSDEYQVIGIILLLIGLEALNGAKNTKWIAQTECVRKMLNTLYAKPDYIGSWELDAVQRHFTYHDAMATVMMGVSKTSPSSLVPRNMPQLLGPPPSLTVDPLMGLSYYLCSLVCRIQYVTAASPAFPFTSEAAFLAIEQEIQQWQYDSPMSLPDVDLPVALDLIALAESYRLAALIHLYRKSDTHKSLVPGCASRAMHFIDRIPPGSPADSSLLYPIFLAGAELDNETDITKCSTRLTAIQARNRYENVGNVQKILQEVWRPVLTGERKRNWEDVLKEWGWSISLS
ncbi:putative Zn(II)2Cys6 transcription factor-like protein [Lophiotrema nucula]|uniref:Putative Zn(II)2Cys6 transcription factor-like protein n=1 Tax=Lophiotrema nucula TaxID=690887 RepID=A0A6A5Z001_9PLEO|nr:putative Zn(II)2Cys6 transcription factor-like protein [Lophiotrema nucula]